MTAAVARTLPVGWCVRFTCHLSRRGYYVEGKTFFCNFFFLSPRHLPILFRIFHLKLLFDFLFSFFPAFHVHRDISKPSKRDEKGRMVDEMYMTPR